MFKKLAEHLNLALFDTILKFCKTEIIFLAKNLIDNQFIL